MIAWWKRAHRAASCGVSAGYGAHVGGGCGGPEGPAWESRFAAGDHDGGGGFGVRRPLRFLAFKLELDEKQVPELARILNDLKTERAQAAVDDRRATSAFADAVAAQAFDAATADRAAAARVASAERLREAVVKALERIHALLTPEQRETFAYLIRTGTISL
jgi:Spy/CpxP family protein refolding chaperone